MAAVTPATVYEESMGSNTLYILNFSAIDTSTYTNAALAATTIGYWANTTSAGGAGSVSLSGNVFTITNAAASPTQVFVVAKQV